MRTLRESIVSSNNFHKVDTSLLIVCEKIFIYIRTRSTFQSTASGGVTALTMSMIPAVAAAPAAATANGASSDEALVDHRQHPESQSSLVAAAAAQSPVLSLLHPTAMPAATAAATADSTTSATTTTDRNGSSNHATSSPLCNSTAAATTACSGSRAYRIVALSVLTLALVFGAGFGLGVLYSKTRCECRDGTVSDTSSRNEKAATAAQPLANATHCTGHVDDDSSSSSSSSGSGDSSFSNTIPPVDELFVPPVFIEETVACLNNDEAMNELRTAVTRVAHLFINQFAYYIRRGGNSSIVFDEETVEWSTEDYVAAMTSAPFRRRRAQAMTTGTGPTIEEATNASLRRSWRNVRSASAKPHGHDRPLSKSHERIAHAQREAAAHRRLYRRKVQSAPTTDSTKTTVLEADMVQTSVYDDELVYVAFGDEIVTLQSSTSAIQSRMRIPKRHPDSQIGGMLLLHVPQPVEDDDPNGQIDAAGIPVLVVMVQEVDYSMLGADSSRSGTVNTTVLVYYPNYDTESINKFKLVQSYSLKGLYTRAFSVQGRRVHVVTRTDIDMFAVQGQMTPAFLQANSSSWYYSEGEPPKLLLNETQYRKLALAQVERWVEATVQALAAGIDPYATEANGQPLDCTGFVALSGRQSNATNLGMGNPSSMVHIVSFDLSSTASSPFQSTRTSTISMLPPENRGFSAGSVLVTETMIVVPIELFSGQDFTIESEPMSWLVAFPLVNASVLPMTTSSLVPGAVNYELGMDHYQARNGKDYLRFITARFDNLVDYIQSFRWASSTRGTYYLQILELASDGLEPAVVGSELASLVGRNSTVVSAEFTVDSLVLVVRSQAVATVTQPPNHTVYTIDTTDPSNPYVGELLIPVTSLDVYSLDVYSVDADWVIGITSFEAHDHPMPQPLQIFLWNASDRITKNAAYHWIDDAVLVSNGTGINSTVSQVIANRDYYGYGVSKAIQYNEESNVLVLPVEIMQYETRSCTSDDYMMYSEGPRRSSSQNQSRPVNCWDDDVTVFDGFWLFKVDLSFSSTGGSGGSFHNMTKHFEINHASPDLLRQECSDFSVGASLPSHSLVFDGDIMTFKRGAVLSYDLLTEAEAAPAVILGSAECD